MSQTFELKLTKYQNQNLSRILNATVEAARNTLKCDRTVICDATKLPRVEILAESAAKNYPSIIGRTIKDPFLEGDYLEMYCYGMSLTIDNIYACDVKKSDLQELEQLKIKSVAVAPICVKNKLLAFLVAHQCSKIQPWKIETVNLLAEKASAAGEAISFITKNNLSSKDLHLAQNIARSQSKRQNCNHANLNHQSREHLQNSQSEILIQAQRKKIFANLQHQLDLKQKPEELLNTTVREVRQLLECDRVLIFDLEVADRGVVVAESVGERWTSILTQDKSGCTAIYLEEDRHGKVRAWNDTSSEDASDLYRQQLEALEVKAGLVAPIANDGQLFGLLIAHQCSDTRHWQQQEINWITQIANYIGTMFEQTKNSPGSQQKLELSPAKLADIKKQLEREKIWTKLFTHVVQKIRNSLTTEDILKASVKEIHRILKCDRALVYALNHDSYGEIVAEAVSPGWTKVEGSIIKDPCFEARYLEKYQDGRFRAWNDIHQAGMSKCYIEQLEQLEVKANLVVPIIKEEKLFGLLVTQQCSNTRKWLQSEILWLTQISTQIGLALDNAQLLADARQLRQQAERERIWTEYFCEAVQQIRTSLKTKDVYQASVREVRRVIDCDRVVVYSLNQDNYGEIVAESVAHGWTRSEGRVIKDPCFEARYLDKYRDGRVRAWSDIYRAGMSKCYIEQLEQLQVKANLVVPIVSNDKLFGLLVAHQCSGTRQWQQPEIDWLTQIATQVSLALENAQIHEQIEQYSKSTQDILERAAVSSLNIQRTVESVTLGFANLSNSCQNFVAAIQKIKDVSQQLAQQSMSISRTMNSSSGEGDRDFVNELSDRIFSSMQELFEATAKIDPLFASIKAEIAAKSTNLESETQQLNSGVNDFQRASQQLEQIVALNLEMSNLISDISNSLDNQIQGSTFTQDSVHKLTNVTKRISQQSIAIIESLSPSGRTVG